MAHGDEVGCQQLVGFIALILARVLITMAEGVDNPALIAVPFFILAGT